jgi:hypothetical protein
MRKLYFANDCHRWHSGSAAVSKYIRQQACKAQYRVIDAPRDKTIDREGMEDCDVILVNGEGTMHDDKSRATHLLDVLRVGQQMGKKTMLVNTIWYGMSHDYDDVLGQLDRLDVRDTQSQYNLHKHGAMSEVYPDLSYWSSNVAELVIDTGYLTTDAWLPGKGWHWPTTVPEGYEYLTLSDQPWPETLRTVTKATELYTGRFHGVMAALKARTPFRACPGNTPKIEGFLKGFHDDTSQVVVPASELYADHDVDFSYWTDLWDWVEEQPRWTL